MTRKRVPPLELQQRKALVSHVQEAMPGTSTIAVCRALEVPRSSFYFRSTRRDDSVTKKAVEETAAASRVPFCL